MSIISRRLLMFVGALAVATLSLVAQGPAPASAAAAQGAVPPAPAGRGASMLEPDFSKKPPVLPLIPAEEAKTFLLPPGFKLELVRSDPDIQESAQIAFDGNGRMFVLELRGYMRDADASGELDPVGRISVHEDRDNNGATRPTMSSSSSIT